MENNLWKWGRVLYSVPLALTGIIYLAQPQQSVETLTSFIPGGLSLIYLAGALWFVLGLLIALEIKTRYAAWGVVIILGFYQIMVHIPAVYTGEYLYVVWFELLRDVSLIGGAFFILCFDHFRQKHTNHSEVEKHA